MAKRVLAAVMTDLAADVEARAREVVDVEGERAAVAVEAEIEVERLGEIEISDLAGEGLVRARLRQHRAQVIEPTAQVPVDRAVLMVDREPVAGHAYPGAFAVTARRGESEAVEREVHAEHGGLVEGGSRARLEANVGRPTHLGLAEPERAVAQLEGHRGVVVAVIPPVGRP